jgi:hypothetical protein
LPFAQKTLIKHFFCCQPKAFAANLLRYFLAKRLAAKAFYLNNPAVLPHKQHGNTA